MADINSANVAAAASAAAAPNRKIWQKNAYDVSGQDTTNPTSVGFLRNNDSRVDVISTMDKGMKQQVFSFQNVSEGKTQLSEQGGNVRIQVLNQANQVIADSKTGMGAASKAYTSLTQGTYDLKPGTYFVVVQRQPGAPTTTQMPYNFQIKQGSTVRNDYISENVPVPAKIQHQQAVAAVQQIAPTPLTLSSTTTIFGSNTADPFGLGGYNIFGQKVNS